MCKKTLLCIAIACSGLFSGTIFATAAHADDSRPTTLNASGVMNSKVKPERIRVAVPLYAHTLSAGESLDLIRERKQVAKDRVIALGCIADSIQFGSVTVEDSSASMNGNSNGLRMLGNMGNQIDIDELPVLVTVRADMTADWLLPEGADEEAVVGIVEKIVADLTESDVTGKDDRPEFSPSVEEALDVLQNQSRAYVSSMNRNDLDKIRYAFVATLTQDAQNVAIRGAYDDAKSQIESLAAATGATVGKPMMVNSNSSLRYSSNVSQSYNGRVHIDVLQARENEVLSSMYSELAFSARVQVQFSAE